MVQTSSTTEIKDKNSTTKKGMADPTSFTAFLRMQICMVVSSSRIVPNTHDETRRMKTTMVMMVVGLEAVVVPYILS